MDEGQMVGRQLVVTSRDSTTLLDLEESFDQVARAIEIRAEQIGSLRLRLGGMLAQAPFSATSRLIQSAS
jgi:hypothetical protein